VKETSRDPYDLTTTSQKDPPRSFLKSLRYLGPGLVSTASIVGSGELIATTALGAKAGFVTLWIILVSCVVKVAIQLEFGKNAIYSGLPTMASFDRLSGIRVGNTHWTVWAYVVIMGSKFLQYGGIVGGVAIILNLIFPELSISIWVWIVAAGVSAISVKSIYKGIERLAVTMVIIFSALTVVCLGMLFFTPYAFQLSDLLQGLSFELPAASLVLAISAFGITGVSADEIVLYPYWCIEKGYASFVGPRDNTSKWVTRARGWIRVMYIDAFVSMAVYTTVTVAFYILGAAILHDRGEIPSGFGMIQTLSTMYTETIGSSGALVFLAGAFATLASTLLISVAGWSRIFTDACARIGLLKFENLASRGRYLGIFSIGLPWIWAILFLRFEVPLLMVTIGGIGTSILLLVLVYSALKFRYQMTPRSLHPGKPYDLLLWLSIATTVGIGVYGILTLFG